jgi:hypothetical protein
MIRPDDSNNRKGGRLADKEGVRLVFAGFFNELLRLRLPENGDELRLCWREAVEETCKQFSEWGTDIATQRVYALVDDFLREVRAMGSFDWVREGF